MKAIGYVRVSTIDQALNGISLDAQCEKIKSWSELNGYKLTNIYTDAGISGKRVDNRPGLQKALSEIGDCDALVVYSLSRLARSTKDTIEIAEQLSKKNADLVSISEKIDTSNAAGKMVFRILAVLSEFERDQISERTKSALAHKRLNGEKTGGDVPYGYDVTPDRYLTENSDEQKTIQFIRKLKKHGMSLRGICKKLKKQGYRTKTGKSVWHPQSIKQILTRVA